MCLLDVICGWKRVRLDPRAVARGQVEGQLGRRGGGEVEGGGAVAGGAEEHRGSAHGAEHRVVVGVVARPTMRAPATTPTIVPAVPMPSTNGAISVTSPRASSAAP
jgi:hypothetical protein